MKQTIRLEARAKINLALDVLYRRGDGFHEVSMVMQTIGLADRVTLSERADGISVECDFPGLECGPSNLAYRAAALFGQHYGVRRGVHITLEKRIPLAAGLAGGSADAAAVLRGLSALWHLELKGSELAALGAQLGSDVPFCLLGGTMLAEGRGETLSALAPLPRVWVVLVKPPLAVSTAWVYGRYNAEAVREHPDIAGMKNSLAQGDVDGVAARLANVLETVTISAHPEIAAIKQAMRECGLVASLMSGSGPTVFGLTQSRQTAEQAAEELKKRAVGWVAVTETVQDLGEVTWIDVCHR